MTYLFPAVPVAGKRLLTAAKFQLAQVPAEIEWFTNIRNPRTCAPMKATAETLCALSGSTPEEFRIVARAHVIG